MATPNTARKVEMNELTPTPDQFAMLRQTIDALEKQGAQRPEGTAPAGRRNRSRKGPNMSVTQQAQSQPAKPNAITLAEMLVVADGLGQETAKGKDAQAKFDLKVIEWAGAGAIDLTKDKHGPGFDDFTKLAEGYYKGRNATNIFDHKEGKQRKLASDLRTVGRLGASPKYGVGEPQATVNSLVTIRQNLRKTANKGVKLEDTHNMLLRYAREQLKRDTLISGEELKSFCFRRDSDPRSAEEVLRSTQKTLIALRDGKLSNCSDVDNSSEIGTCINAINKRLSAIAKAKGAANQQSAA